jgi:diguanylate cyclase (GGDEF)-like protein
MECVELTNLQSQASKNALQLSLTTSKAINAIKDKNESLLQEVLRETEKLRKEVEKLKKSVYKDELTHVYNRKWLHDYYLSNESDIFNQDGILAIIDLNYFKQINDTYGHIIGDKVLIFIANQLKKSKQRVIRYGGDEFIMIFSKELSMQNAFNSLKNIRENVISKKLKSNDSSFKVSFSFGLAKFNVNDDLASIIELADKNMYNDKIEIKKRVTEI